MSSALECRRSFSSLSTCCSSQTPRRSVSPSSRHGRQVWKVKSSMSTWRRPSSWFLVLAVVKKSGKYPGAACSRVVGNNSIQCSQCMRWVHKKCSGITKQAHYAKLSRAMRAPWVDRFLNNEIYCYPLSKKRCGSPVAIPRIVWLEGILTSGRQQCNDWWPLQFEVQTISAAGVRVRLGVSMAELWTSVAPCLMWKPLSATYVISCAPVPLLPDVVWPGESSGNSCLF